MTFLARALVLGIAGALAACDTSANLPSSELCGWAQQEDNCWRRLVREVEACLVPDVDASTEAAAELGESAVDAQRAGDDVSPSNGLADATMDGQVDARDAPDGRDDGVPGVLDLDGGRVCSYLDQSRIVTSEGSLLTSAADASAAVPTRSFRVERAGKTCLRFRQTNPELDGVQVHAEGPTETVDVRSDKVTIDVTCSDGTKVSGEVGSVLRCLDLAGGMPGIATEESETTVWLSLLGMKRPVYWCALR